MLIAHYDPATLALIEVFGSLGAARDVVWMKPHPLPEDPATSVEVETRISDISWTRPITNAALAVHGAPLRIVDETTPPAVDSFQTRSYTIERQLDASWLQVWATQDLAMPVARELMRNYARGILQNPAHLEAISTAEVMAFQEVSVVNAEIAAAGGPGTIDPARYPHISSIAANRGVSLVEARDVVAAYRDAYSTQAEGFIPGFFNAIDAIQDASDLDDLRAIKAILDSL